MTPDALRQNPYQVRIKRTADGLELTWEPQNGEDAHHGITGPIAFGDEVVLRGHPGGIHVYSERPEDNHGTNTV